MTEPTLPPLPEPYEVSEVWGQNVNVYTANQMQAYARQAMTGLMASAVPKPCAIAQPVQPAPIPSNPGELEKEAFWRDTITKTHFEMGFPESCQPPPPDAIDALIKAEAALEFALDVVRCYEEGGGASETGEFIAADLAVVRATIAAQQDRAERPPEPVQADEFRCPYCYYDGDAEAREQVSNNTVTDEEVDAFCEFYIGDVTSESDRESYKKALVQFLMARQAQPVASEQQEPLTGHQIDLIWESVPDCDHIANYKDQRKFARAIEAAHGIAAPANGEGAG